MSQLEISQKEFQLFKSLVYQEFGISLSDKKITLVQSRLRKWVKNLGYSSYEELYQHFLDDPSELFLLADAITTNVTSFFREASQWEYLKGYIPTCKSKKLRIWSSACSSGQEPYTVAIFLLEHIKDFKAWDIKILATDLSEDILKKAMKGEYIQKDMEGLTKSQINKYFNKTATGFAIKRELRDMVVFKSFNLVTGNYGMFKNKFDLIFCRNVMIYFDKKTQNDVIANLTSLINIGSLLLIGHSEAITNKEQTVKLVASSIYKKVK